MPMIPNSDEMVPNAGTGGGAGGTQSNQTIGFYAGGNTTGAASTGTLDARSLSFDAAGIASMGVSNGSIVLSVPAGGGAGATFSAGVSTGGNTLGNTGTVSNQLILAGGNNITLSQSTAPGGATVTISGPNTAAQSNQTEGLYATGNTIGNSSSLTYDARSLTMEFDGIVSGGWSTNNSHLLISASQSAQTEGFYAVGNTTGQSSSTTLDARTHSIDGAGIVSVGFSGGSLVISATDAAQSNQTDGIYATGNTIGNSSSLTHDARSLTIEFDGIVSGGWSSNNSHLLISATTAAQTNQTQGLYGVGNTTGQSSSTTADARSLSFDGAGIVSVGMSGGSVVISATDAAQSNQTLGAYATGNTTGNSSSLTYDARSLTIEFDGIVSGGWSTNNSHLLISASQSNQTEGLYAVGNTTGQSSSTTVDARSLSFDGAGAISVGYSGGSVVISGPAAGQGFTAGVSTGGNTSGTTGTTNNQLILAGGNNITLSESTGAGGITVTVSAFNQSNQTEGVYATGNTTGNSSSLTYDARSLTIEFDGIVSGGWSSNNSHLLISASQSNQTEGYYAVGNTTGQSSSTTLDARTLSVDGAGIVSVGYSGGSLVISATDAAQTNQTLGVYATGNTTGNSSSLTYDARSLTIEFDGIISGGWSTNNSHLLISASQSNQTLGLYGVGNTTAQSSSTTADARSLSFDGAGAISVGMSGGSVVISGPSGGAAFSAGISGGNTSGNTGTVSNQLVFAGGNNITLSGSTGAAGETITISAFNQSNQTLGGYASGNTTGNSSSLTYDARSLTIEFDGIVSGGWSTNNSHLLISASQSNQTEGLYAVGNTTGQSSSTTIDARTQSVNGAGIVSVGYSGAGGSLVISATQSNQTEGMYVIGNTTAQSSSTTIDARTQSISATGAVISAGFSGAAGDLVLSSPQVISHYQNIKGGTAAIQALSGFGNGAVWMNDFDLMWPLSCTQLQLPAKFTFTSGATASAAVSWTINAAVYSRETANTAVLSNIFSGSITGWGSISSNARAAVNWNGQSTSSAGTGLLTQLSGLKLISIPFATLLPPGEYWLAINALFSTTGSATVYQVGLYSAENNFDVVSQWGYPADSVASRGYLGGWNQGFGLWSGTSVAPPTTMNITAVSQEAVSPLCFNLMGAGTA